MHRLARAAATRPGGRFWRPIHKALFSRSFTQERTRRLLILFEERRIAYASVFPFLSYAEAFAERYDVEIRLLSTEQALSHGISAGLSTATHVLAQTWLTDPLDRHQALARCLEKLPGGPRLAYLDSFANADIRLAAVFTDIDLYFKKSLFVEPTQFLRPTRGDTNLAAYYGPLHGIAEAQVDWQVPATALDKLHLAPNFLTAPGLSKRLSAGVRASSQSARRIDVHARIGGLSATGWYGAMRRAAAETVARLPGLTVASGSGLRHAAYMAELGESKICFSPFGYGEVCWRDVEAICEGAVLLKPDMGHLRTIPNLYEDDVTYVACAWDFSDVPDKIDALLTDTPRRTRIATAARARAVSYMNQAGPVTTYAPLFKH